MRGLCAAPALLALALGALALAAPARAQEGELTAQQSEELFSQVDGMLATLTEITGLTPRKPIPREILTREQIRDLIEVRIAEDSNPEKIRREELFLRLFGFVGDDFDLKSEVVEVLAEQATALYDFQTRKLYMATWTPADMQEFALVHELAHALADQHFNLGKFVKGAKTSEQDIARAAVMEGQASWLMTEYVMRQGNRSMVGNRLLAVAASSTSKIEADRFPVFANAPLFLRETMLFPYAEGLMFQQAVIDRLGEDAFAEVFRNPPANSQHILNPETYLAGRQTASLALPAVKLPRGFRRIHEGEIGQLDHRILLNQYVSQEVADDLSPRWRGGRYEIHEHKKTRQAVLTYAVRWETPEDAARYLDLYKMICAKKWGGVEFDKETDTEASGRAAGRRFRLSRNGTVFTSVEGLGDDTVKSSSAQ
ncbi:MAG: hypothetical protein O2968_07920 [Acidobacteria bacterium]|nr:hypothetical protein [Acidobacteriota bacterium]